MLYEVITGSTTMWIASQPFGGVVSYPSDNGAADHRITSYNVCYTKLLRAALERSPLGAGARDRALSEVMALLRRAVERPCFALCNLDADTGPPENHWPWPTLWTRGHLHLCQGDHRSRIWPAARTEWQS